VTLTVTDPAASVKLRALIVVVDQELPMVEARPCPNPSDKKVPVAGKSTQ